jgi:hypothetical protein
MATTATNLTRLERAADVIEIREVLARYCRGVDRRDFDLVLSCYHDDATERHADFSGKASDFYTIVKTNVGSDLTVFHITNVSVEFGSPESALSEAYYLAIVRGQDGPIDTFMSGRYIDRFECRGGEWKIAARLATSDWWALKPRNRLPVPDGAEAKLIRGTLGKEDPYYAVRAAFLGQ